MRLVLAPFADIESTDSGPLHHHNNAQGLKIYFSEQRWDWIGYFKFTFVRNPWERMVSFYHFGKWDRHHCAFWSLKYEESSAGRVPFKEWLVRKVKNRHPREPGSINEFAYGVDGRCLIDRIFKVEEIDQAIIEVADRLELPLREQTPSIFGKETGRAIRVNDTRHHHYNTYYDEESYEAVRNLFKADIELGNYKFEHNTLTPPLMGREGFF